MILSMTGFGQARREAEGHAYHLELHSVNNRYFKAAVRLPDELAFLETELEQLLRGRLVRGSVTLRLHVRDLSAAAAAEVNPAAVRSYVEQLQAALSDAVGLTIDLATLATLPGVCQPRELTEEQRQRGGALVRELTEAALEELGAMRAAEGQALADDLRQHCRFIRQRLDGIRARVPAVVTAYRDRLLARVRELVAETNVRLAEEDLLKEVAIYAERSDISEELSRLDSHLEQFEEAIGSPEAAGRKLEFIAQEMQREANTIGSKAGDAQISRDVIEIKGAIDRLKEQAQNVV